MTLIRRTVLVLLVLGLAFPVSALAQARTAQVRGVLLTEDGTPAVGYQLGLKNERGDYFISSPTAVDGSFTVSDLPPAVYTLAAFDPEGVEFPVLGRSVRLEAGQVERVELRIGDAEGTPPGRDEAEMREVVEETRRERRGGGFWRSTAGRVVMVTGGVFALALAISAADDDDDDRPVSVSPVTPSAR